MARANRTARGRAGAVRTALRFSLWLLSFTLAAGRLGQAQVRDANQLLAAQMSKLGGGPGTLVLDTPARLGSTLTLAAGQSLRIAAPLTVGAVSIRLSGHNQVRCTAPITVENAANLFVAEDATDLDIGGCQVAVTGRSGGYLLTATRSARVTLTGNHLTGMAIFNTHNVGAPNSRTTDVNLTGNSTEFPHGGGPIGIYLLYVIGGNVTGNHFGGTGHGIEWWGGDANQFWPGFAAVNAAGKLTISDNVCVSAGGSCVWGSDGFDIRVTGNSADTCSDVCFDTEGGVRTVFLGNTAKRCQNGCLAAEFESEDAVFQGNTASADGLVPEGPLVLIKHPSGRGPNHLNLVVTGNTLTCTKLCSALYSEGEDGFTFSRNMITNGFLQFINYTNNVSITGNELHFKVPVEAAAGISGPSLANAHHSVISGNTVLAEGGTAGNAACIAQSWSDYNSTDEMEITRNTCAGFRVGIVTATGGGNPGAPQAIWTIKGNQFSGIPPAQQIVHQHSSGNEQYHAQ